MKHSLLEACHFVCSFVRLGFRNRNPHYKICLFLLVTVLSQSFFAFVSSHLVAFSFLSAWHNYFILKMLLYFLITGYSLMILKRHWPVMEVSMESVA